MFTQNPLLLVSPLLPTVTENGIPTDYEDYYNLAISQSSSSSTSYYKDTIDSKMQRRDSGVELSDPVISQNIFHDFITAQDHSIEQDESSLTAAAAVAAVAAAAAAEEEFYVSNETTNGLESATNTFFETYGPPSPTSSCDDLTQNFDFRKFYKLEDSSMFRAYSYFGGLNEISDVEVCNPAAISPLPPSPIPVFGEQHNDCYMKSLPYEYHQFAAHPGSLSPISPSTEQFGFPPETDSDCNSMTSSSSPSSPEPSSPLVDPMSLNSDALAAVESATQVTSKPQRSRGRRVSNRPDASGGKLFTCKAPNCGKVFKRSEHLKRHHRSIHTSDKPFPCPIPTCSKRFSRSDNLNQHIRIHRHGKDSMKSSGRHFSNFTPFYASAK